MKQNKRLNRINNLIFDLLAEYIVAAFVEDGAGFDDFEASFNGSLKRKWSFDIILSEIIDYNKFGESIRINISRDGIYDSLPENIIHELSNSDLTSGTEMAKDSKRLKKEEKDARQFFKPFEQELFIQGVNISLKENSVFNKIISKHILGLKSNFWQISQDLSSNKNTQRLIRLIPFASRITGNIKFTAQCLSYILNEDVRTNYIQTGEELKELENSNFSLGKLRLGIDSVTGNVVNDFFGKFVFYIGPLKNTQLEDYLNNGRLKRVIEIFFSYFLPVELESSIKIELEHQKGIVLTDYDSANCHLGYNTYL